MKKVIALALALSTTGLVAQGAIAGSFGSNSNNTYTNSWNGRNSRGKTTLKVDSLYRRSSQGSFSNSARGSKTVVELDRFRLNNRNGGDIKIQTPGTGAPLKVWAAGGNGSLSTSYNANKSSQSGRFNELERVKQIQRTTEHFSTTDESDVYSHGSSSTSIYGNLF